MPEELEKQIEEAVVSIRESLKFNAEDDELKRAIVLAVDDSKELKIKIDAIGQKNELFWKKGTDLDLSQIHPKKSKTVNNRIFAAVETAIPILTAEMPEPSIPVNIENNLRERILKILQIAYEVDYSVQAEVQKLVRNWFIYRIGVWKYRWDKDNGFQFETVLPKKIGFDPRATSLKNCEYIFEVQEDSFEDLFKKFPAKKDEIKKQFDVNEKKIKSKVTYLEFWGGNGQWVAWKLGEILLDKKKNPNFDYGNEENNLFKIPRFPYILLLTFNLGIQESGIYDSTSLIEQSIPLQEGANKLERQILDLNDGQKRVWVVSGEAMKLENFQRLVDRTGDLGVYMDKKAPSGGVAVPLSGKPDASLFNNLSHLLSEIDNIMGVHSTTRGERREQETFGGRKLMLQSDLGRLDLIVRNVEQALEEWFLAFLHMQKVYGEDNLTFENEEKEILITKGEIPQDLKIMIKKGSMLPVDKASRAEMAIQLSGRDMIDPQTLFEELGYGNEEERAKKLFDWLVRTGKAQPEPPQSPEQQQLSKVKQLMESDEFKKLSPEEQQEMVGRAKGIVAQIKAGGTIQ